MSKTEYTVNSIAWTLLGIVLTLTYQRIANWWYKRNKGQGLPAISATTYFGSLLVLFSIIGVLFSYSAKLGTERSAKEQRDCIAAVSQNNIAVLSQFKAQVTTFEQQIDNLKAQELLLLEGKRSLAQVKNDFRVYFAQQDAARALAAKSHLIPQTQCQDSPVSPSDIPGGTHSPSRTPTRSPTRSR